MTPGWSNCRRFLDELYRYAPQVSSYCPDTDGEEQNDLSMHLSICQISDLTGPRPRVISPIDEASIFFQGALIWCRRAAGARSSMKLLLVRPRASVSSWPTSWKEACRRAV